MFSRHTYLVLGLFASSALPYFSSSPEVRSKLTSWASNGEARPAENTAESPFRLTSTNQPSTDSNPEHANVEPSRSVDSNAGSLAVSSNDRPSVVAQNVSAGRLASSTKSIGDKKATGDEPKRIEFYEVFRLDVNSNWLMTRWPRVTTGLTDLELHGYRVSLLTGTREDDVAGALTYYYDPQQVIQKMTFRGFTGDPRQLVLFCTSQYGFEREVVNDPSLQVYRSQASGRRQSQLTIRPARIIRADAPRERFEVDLVLLR